MRKVKLRNKKFTSQSKPKTSRLKWIKKEMPLENGGYNIGPEGKYFLSEAALSHIMHGDFTERLIEVHGQRTGDKETILKGGLHTYQAWMDFKNSRNDIVHLKKYNSNTHKLWYYARSLQNGVITLKIPRELFQSKAANLTKFPDTYYKSGYLWKTLFPKEKTKDDILNIIDEALFNLDREETQSGILIGYALMAHPFTGLKIRIQCIENKINSAFPTWEQPMTGNTGKAFSHADTISFTIALSTEYFDESDNNEFIESNIYMHTLGITSVLLNTPSFLLSRPVLPNNGELDIWMSSREVELSSISKNMSENNIQYLQKYLEDSFICKNGYPFQQGAYHEIYGDLEKDIALFNAISISQNIIECITVINNYDQINKTTYLMGSMTHILLNKVLYTGALDSWNNKVLHNKILDFILLYHNTNIIPMYINAISQSPIRSSLYTEFDLANICYKKEFNLMNEDDAKLFAIMNLPIDNYIIKPKYFKDYLLLNLSENYFMNFDEKTRDNFVDNIIKELGVNFEKMVDHSTNLTSIKDFIFFQEKFNQLTEIIITKQIVGINNDSLSIIIKDFFRIQTAQRMKVFLRKSDFELNAMDYFDYDSEEYKLHTLIKHERRVNVFSLEWFLDDALKIATYMNDEKLIIAIDKYKSSVWTERPPQSKFIPSYIKHWSNQKDKSWERDFQHITKPSSERSHH